MRAFVAGLAAAGLAISVAAAQNTGGAAGGGNAAPGGGGSMSRSGTAGTGNGSTVGNAMSGAGDAVNRAGKSAKDAAGSVVNTSPSAAAGDNNQAVATTNANAPQPAKGSNSFTAGEAQGRIQRNGFSDVKDLKKDDSGVWRGQAQKDGRTVSVWLDYKGNVGAQ